MVKMAKQKCRGKLHNTGGARPHVPDNPTHNHQAEASMNLIDTCIIIEKQWYVKHRPSLLARQELNFMCQEICSPKTFQPK